MVQSKAERGQFPSHKQRDVDQRSVTNGTVPLAKRG